MQGLVLVVAAVSLLAGPAQDNAVAVTGVEYCPEVSHSVVRLYRAYFGRDADAGGFAYWLGQYMSGTPLVSISDNFTRSQEFTTRYGGLDDRSFVRLVYVNVLGREPEQAGWDYWTDALARRLIVRGGVMVQFSESPEFVSRTATASPLPIPPGSFTYCGTGDDVIGVATPGGGKGAVVVAAMFGTGNNAIISHGPGFSYNDLLVNDIGPYLGERLMDLVPYTDRSETFEVKSNGRWIIQIRPLSTVAPLGASTSGAGDRVLRYDGRPAVGHFTHDGRSNFIVEAVSPSDWDLVVNEIGPYDGRAPVSVGPSYIAITADGSWTATIPG